MALQAESAMLSSWIQPRPLKDVPMLVLLIASAIAASLLVELGIMVARDWLDASELNDEDERQMNSVFKRTSGGAW
jgi:hypothetical protein